MPEVGHPLNVVDSHALAYQLASQIKDRKEFEHALEIKSLSDRVHDLKKQVHGLTRVEKGKLYSGDKTILYDKLGLADEEDLDKYRGKVGIKDPDIDYLHLDEAVLDEKLDEAGLFI